MEGAMWKDKEEGVRLASGADLFQGMLVRIIADDGSSFSD